MRTMLIVTMASVLTGSVVEAQYGDRARIRGSLDIRLGGRRSLCGTEGYQFAAPQSICPPAQFSMPQQFSVPQFAPQPQLVCPPSQVEYVREPSYARSRDVDPCLILMSLAKLEGGTDRIGDEQRYQTHILYEMLSESKRQADLSLIAATRMDREPREGPGPGPGPGIDPTTLMLLRCLQERNGGGQPQPQPGPGPIVTPPVVVPVVPYVQPPQPAPQRDYGPDPRGYAPQGPAPSPMSSQGHRSWPQVGDKNIRRMGT